MIEQAIFNADIARELEARGFKLVGKSKLAWFFADSPELEIAVEECLRKLALGAQ
jgi:hypothetical protein